MSFQTSTPFRIDTSITWGGGAWKNYKPREMKVYGAICVDSNGYVLLVKGRRSKKWSFPKGHCKKNETDIECAKRELKEETGILVDTNYVSTHKLRGGTYFIFAMEKQPPIQINDHWEIEDVQWWPLTNLPRLDSNVDVSIFRTLMKGVSDNAIDFLESPRSRQKVAYIKNCMDNATKECVEDPLPIV
jgi:8-oxo-dGTP pyrophosphatase MutT (NUDIX family)